MISSVSMVIPAFNEETALESCVTTVVGQLTQFVRDFEVVVVNDGSSDRTGVIADGLARRFPQVRVIHSPRNGGLGDACRLGIAAASKEHVAWVSADTAWPMETLRAVFAVPDADVITVYAKDPGKRSLLRRTLSRTFTAILNVLSGCSLRYYNGAAFYRAVLLKSIVVESDGLTFWAEALVKALRAGCTHRELPADFPERCTGQTKAFKWKNILATAKFLGRMVQARCRR